MLDKMAVLLNLFLVLTTTMVLVSLEIVLEYRNHQQVEDLVWICWVWLGAIRPLIPIQVV